jgi:Actinobacteria/chloroflexi VLRF1 release factor
LVRRKLGPMARYIGRENLRKRLEGYQGGPGRTVYADGAVTIDLPETLTVRPPFGLGHEGSYETVELEPLFDALARDHVVAVLLVRLGGFAVGVFDGERLVASKVGTRFVKGRHKKGGSSANRFRRRREKQERELIEAAAATALDVLGPWEARAEFAALGGDRRAVDEVLESEPRLAWLRERALTRFFTTGDPRLRELERLAYGIYSAEMTEGAL